METPKGPVYQTNEVFIFDEVYVTIPLSVRGWSKLKDSEAWKNLCERLAEVQTEDWILNPRNHQELLDIPGYIQSDRALQRCLQCGGTIRGFLTLSRKKCIDCPIEWKCHRPKLKDGTDSSPAKK